jgi:hypothetical protein
MVMVTVMVTVMVMVMVMVTVMLMVMVMDGDVHGIKVATARTVKGQPRRLHIAAH